MRTVAVIAIGFTVATHRGIGIIGISIGIALIINLCRFRRAQI